MTQGNDFSKKVLRLNYDKALHTITKAVHLKLSDYTVF